MVNIRTATLADCAGIAHVQVDSYLSAYSDLMPPNYFSAFSYTEQEQDWKDWIETRPDLLLVAEIEPGEVIGYAQAQKAEEPKRGFDCEIVALHVNRNHHRQGVGRALMAEAALRMHAAGCCSLGLWVLDGNPAVDFYRHLGGIQSGEKYFEIGELHLRRREVGFVWARIEDLYEQPPLNS